MNEPFRTEGIDHVTVTTPEEFQDEVIDWYTNCLGFERIEKPAGTRPSGAWLRSGDTEIHVSIDEHSPPPVAHFGLVVDRLDSAVEQLRRNSCHVEQASPIPGRHRCFTRDPVGNKIELIAFEEGHVTVTYEEKGASD